jgi:hypothetical protein
MSVSPEEQYTGEGRTLEEAVESAAKTISNAIRNETYELTIYAELSGEHNPIHAYKVVLSPGSP